MRYLSSLICAKLACASVVLGLLSSPASAEPGARPLLVLGDASPETVRAIIKQLRRRAIASERLSRPGRRGSDALADAVRRSAADIKRAKDAYYRAEVVLAARLLGAIIESKAKRLMLANRPEVLGEAYYWLAICRAKAGDEAGAKDAFAAAIHLGATGGDRARFSPRVRALRDAVARSVADRSGQQRLTVAVKGRGAAVRVDGKRLDRPSVTLAPGIHWLSVSAPGMSAHVKRFRIERSPLALTLTLLPATAAERRQQLETLQRALSGKDARRAALSLGALRGRDEVLLVGESRVSGGALRLSLTRMRVTDRQIVGRFQQQSGAAQLEAMIRRGLMALWPLPRAARSAPVYRRWWFWTAAGAAVVGGTLAAIFATQASSSTRVTVVMDPPP